jgi:predicted transcriptional regulator
MSARRKLLSMARKTSPHFTDAELRLMNVLWDQGPATVTEVLEGLKTKPQLAYSTVITTLRILETKGFVSHTKEGRSFTWAPIIGRCEARQSAISQLLQRLFEGKPELLVTSLFEDRKISAAELRRLQRLIDQTETEEKQS